ncbi:alpha/beta hydrolase [Sphingomonas faeni]|uniref:alpha/beta hydrolase n=1 Tax=Sphingomonas faeni TaxID=185950 RepID=UPI00241376EA|nr:alpha/beta hydrolase-fold protein [Sphingomonas faeni]
MASERSPAHPFAIEDSEVFPIHSRAGHIYDIYVKTPPGYNDPENSNHAYPIVYLTDGAYTFQVASGVARLPFNQGRFDKFIIVGLSGAKGQDAASSRRRDLTPWPDSDVEGITGGGPAYLDFIKTQAIPLVEQRYRADPKRRTLIGQSYGGLFTLWIALTEPTIFENYIATSPSLWFGRERLLRMAPTLLKQPSNLKSRIYIATGSREHPQPDGCDCEHDLAAAQTRYSEILRRKHDPNLKLRDQIIAETYHETTFPVGLTLGLQWLFLKN